MHFQFPRTEVNKMNDWCSTSRDMWSHTGRPFMSVAWTTQETAVLERHCCPAFRDTYYGWGLQWVLELPCPRWPHTHWNSDIFKEMAKASEGQWYPLVLGTATRVSEGQCGGDPEPDESLVHITLPPHLYLCCSTRGPKEIWGSPVNLKVRLEI